MPGLKLANGLSHFVDDRLSIGIYIKDDKAVLIDSGIDADTAKKVDKILEAKNCKVAAIINTHYHADHCGGNHYFQKKYSGLKIYCTKAERGFIECPELEPSCFCGTAAPFAELRNKYMQATPSDVTDVIKEYADQSIEILGEAFKIVTLPGHTKGMIGVITPDNVFYCGDAIFRGDTFNKHSVLFYTDIKATLTTLDKIAALPGVEKCVFYHGGLMTAGEDLPSITALHKDKILKTMNTVLELIPNEKITLDDLTEKVMVKLNVPSNVMQYSLTQTCVNAYLTYLQEQKLIQLSVNKWRKLKPNTLFLF